MHVEQDAGWRPGTCDSKQSCAVRETDDLVATSGQHHRKCITHGGIVVDDENLAPRLGIIGHVPSSYGPFGDAHSSNDSLTAAKFECSRICTGRRLNPQVAP